jgi:type VI secretion system protein ImpB
MANGTQGKLGKVRPPRVQITYDVEIGGGSKEKELPFVVGVIADLTARGGDPEQRLRDRQFIEVDSENIDKVMTAMRPAVSLNIPNKLTGEGQININMELLTMESFSPESVAESIPQLAKLLEARVRLSDLLSKLEGNERLNDLLAEVVSNTVIQEQAQTEASRKRLPVSDANSDSNAEEK